MSQLLACLAIVGKCGQFSCFDFVILVEIKALEFVSYFKKESVFSCNMHSS